MPRPYPREFRDDVVRVAQTRDAGVTVEQIANDFGVHPMTLFKWLRAAGVDAGAKPGAAALAMVGDVGPRLHLALGVTWACMLVGLGFSTWLWLSAGRLVGVGLFQVTFMTVALSRLQRATPENIRGRIMALHSQAMTGATPVGAAGIGFVAGFIGAGVTSVLSGVLAAAVAIGVWVGIRSTRFRLDAPPHQ